MIAVARSETLRNSRKGLPSPQTEISFDPEATALLNLLSNPGKTCEFSKSKLSNFPYKFVGIKESQSCPYCFLYASTNLTPAIFAIAYASLVGSNRPVNSEDSLIGCSENFG